jgi:hypothetical protein
VSLQSSAASTECPALLDSLNVSSREIPRFIRGRRD